MDFIVSYTVPAQPFPLGDRLEGIAGATELSLTFLLEPIPYVIAASPRDRSCPDAALTQMLEQARRRVSARAGLVRSAAVPKLGVVTKGWGEGSIGFRTRIADGKPWHPRMAASGLLALGVALTSERSVASEIDGPLTDFKLISTDAGPRLIERIVSASGQNVVRICISDVQLDVKAGGRTW
jgi:hypothetical protein